MLAIELPMKELKLHNNNYESPYRTQPKFIAQKSAMYKTTKEKIQSGTPKIPSFISLNLPALVTPDH